MTVGVYDVPADERWIVEGLGRYHRTLPPGRWLIVPLVDRVTVRIPVDQQAMEWTEHGRALVVRGGLRFTSVYPTGSATLIAGQVRHLRQSASCHRSAVEVGQDR